MSDSRDVIYFLLRWMHYFFGVIWIGHLYYFNFTQAPFFAEADASTKSAAVQKLLPRALWWFRWGAMFTFLTGFGMLSIWGARVGGEAMRTSFGMFIMVGATLGTLMFLNVWLIIWPAQQVVIASATAVAQGQSALPDVSKKAASALLASRTNVMFSLPMLFFMGAASHLPVQAAVPDNYMTAFLGSLVIIGLLQLNAVKGKLGPLTSVVGVIHCGVGLTALLFGVLWVLV